MAPECRGDEKPPGVNGLQRFLDIHGTLWVEAVERAMGVEPTSLAWEARVMPLYDARTGRDSTRV